MRDDRPGREEHRSQSGLDLSLATPSPWLDPPVGWDVPFSLDLRASAPSIREHADLAMSISLSTPGHQCIPGPQAALPRASQPPCCPIRYASNAPVIQNWCVMILPRWAGSRAGLKV